MSEEHELRVLILEDQATDAELMERELSSGGVRFTSRRVASESEFRDGISRFGPDLILADYSLPSFDGMSALAIARETCPDIPFLFVSGAIGEELATEALKSGATGYVLKSRLQRLVSSVRRALREAQERNARREAEAALRKANDELAQKVEEISRLKARLERENVYLKEELRAGHEFDEIIGESAEIRRVLDAVLAVAVTDTTVLIQGETGTGKELIARAIHRLSPLEAKPLVKVDCTTLSSGIVESELFGHEKGAFTGAVSRKIGRFELADGGTVFLDEIGDLPLELQAKLLRVLEDGELERVGGNRTRSVDVRVIAATNRDLEAAVRNGDFRSDLFYRISVFPIHVPPLRARRDDILPLVEHFVARFARKMGKEIDAVPARAIEQLTAYGWPGNVRELVNVIERTVILSDGPELGSEGLPAGRASLSAEPSAQPETQPREEPGAEQPDNDSSRSLAEVEKVHVFNVLAANEGNKMKTARDLGIDTKTLYKRLRAYGVFPPRDRS